MRTRTRTPGFTLIELLIAVVVLAVMAALAWRGLDAVARTRDAALARSRAADRLSLSLRQLDADLRAARDEGALLPAVSLAGNGDLLIVRRAPEALGADPRSWPPHGTPADAGLVEVARWGLRGGNWMRWASTPSASPGPVAAAMQAPQGPGLALLPGVAEVKFLVFRYAGIGLLTQSGAWVNPYTASGGGNGNDPVAMTLRTPAALRVTLRIGAAPLRGTLTREFLIENRQ